MRTLLTLPTPSLISIKGTKLRGRSLLFQFLRGPLFPRSHRPVGVIQEERVRDNHQVGVPLYSLSDGCIDRLLGGIPGLFEFGKAELISSKPFGCKGNHHHPSDEERAACDKQLFVY